MFMAVYGDSKRNEYYLVYLIAVILLDWALFMMDRFLKNTHGIESPVQIIF